MNAPTGVDWTAALLVLAAGLVLGTVIVWKVLGRARAVAGASVPAPASAQDALSRRDLEGKRLALFTQLRELDETASKRTDDQLARERYALELEAARTLLALGETEEAASRAASVPSAGSSALGDVPPATDRAAMRGFLWGTLSAGGVGLLLFLLYAQARPRDEGGSLTGDIPGARSTPPAGMAAAGAPAAPDAGEAQLRERISRNPDDLDAHMGLARKALARQDMMTVWNETKVVLERSPGHPQALAYQALVRLAMGQGDVALELLQQSLARDPDLMDAYVHKALVQVRLGRVKEAEATIAEASRRFPGEAPGLGRLLADLKQGQTAAETPTPGAEADPHAGLPMPGAGAAPAPSVAEARPPVASSSSRRVSGSVDLDPSLRAQVAAQGVLFVFVREAGFGAGPPIAAKRLPVSSFPVAFEIGEADAMMGQSFPDALLVEARLDADGDPTTRPPTDPKARLDDVKSGTTDVKLILKRAS